MGIVSALVFLLLGMRIEWTDNDVSFFRRLGLRRMTVDWRGGTDAR